MCSVLAVEQRLEDGNPIILDGGTGTELERRGVPMDAAAWCAAALSTHPDTVREVHEDYIRAGAEVIITNSFPAARHVLEPAGLGERFRELNARSVELARQARESAAEEPVFVAGSISTFPPGLDSGYDPPASEARENYREQAGVLAEAGVDLLAIEMIRDLAQSGSAVRAAAETGLPVWLGFSCKVEDDGKVVLWDRGHSLAEALGELTPLVSGSSVVSIMHTLTEDTLPALDVVRQEWAGPVGAYPHSGKFIMPHWQFIDMISPEDFAAEAESWLDRGARLLGGCCGIVPEHISFLRQRLSSRRER